MRNLRLGARPRRPIVHRARSTTTLLDALLVEQFLAFRHQFGRNPGTDDPVIFDPADEPVARRYEDAEASITTAARAVGIDPVLIYAMQMSGMLLTATSADLVDDEELGEWTPSVATGSCAGRPRA